MAEQEQSNNGSGLDPTETENRLASQKSEKQNGASEAVDQLLNAGVNQSKKQFLIAALPYLLTAAVVLCGMILAAFLLFSVAMVYRCASQKSYVGLAWTTSFGTNFIPLLKEASNGSCLPDTSSAPAPANGKTVATPPAAVPQQVPADQTIQ